MNKTAIVVGATGLVGNVLISQLLNDSGYTKIKIFTRKSTGLSHLKLEELIVDLSKIESFEKMITGDELYCCLGTTIKKAGSKENFRKVDYDMPLQMAKAAFKNGIKSYLLVSSVGANAESSNFYLRTKGEVEHAVKEVGFEKLIILQPSFLLGKRNEFRLGEKIGKIIFRFFELFLFGKLKKYQAVQAENVAKTMIYLANAKYEKTVYQSDEINFICERVIKS